MSSELIDKGTRCGTGRIFERCEEEVESQRIRKHNLTPIPIPNPTPKPGPNPNPNCHNPMKTCDPGRFSNFGTQGACIPCPAGSGPSVDRGSCAPCPGGRYSRGLGFGCQLCPAGKFGNKPVQIDGTTNKECELCPLGTFSHLLGAVQCTGCLEGRYAPARGAPSCVNCPSGRYAHTRGLDACHACPNGTMSSALLYPTDRSQQLDVQNVKIMFNDTHEVQELCLNASASLNCTFRLLYEGSRGRAMSPILNCRASDTEIERSLEGFRTLFPGLSQSLGPSPDNEYERCRNITFSAGVSSAGNVPSLRVESNDTASAPVVKTQIHGTDGVGGSFRVRVTYGCEEEAGGCRQSAWSSPIPANASAPTFDAAMAVLADVGGTKSKTSEGYSRGSASSQDLLRTARSWNITFIQRFGNLSVVEIDDTMLSVSGNIADSSLQVAVRSRLHAKISATASKISDGRIQGRPLTGCTTCEVGKSARLKGSATCTRCPKGTFAGTRGQDLCTACPAGKYGDVRGLVQCKACAPGMFAAGEVKGEMAEVEEWHMRRGNVLCYYCPVGRATDVQHTAECPRCTPGKHATEPGMTVCTDCEPGKYAEYGLEDCVRCAPGTYANSSGWPRCKVCEQGKASMLEGSRSCSICNAGRYSNANGRLLPYECKACPVGRSSPTVGTSKCSICGTGTYAGSQGAQECFSCAEHSVQASDRSSCVCMDGFRTYEKDGPCFRCEQGAFCDQCQGVYDRLGKCCGGVLDADERCCDADLVDACGLCAGNHSSCKVRFSVRLNETFGEISGTRRLVNAVREQQYEERRLNVSLEIAEQVAIALDLPKTRIKVEDIIEDRNNVGLVLSVLPLNKSRDLSAHFEIGAAGSNGTLIANFSSAVTNGTANVSSASNDKAEGDPLSTRMDLIAEKLRTMLANPTSAIYTGAGGHLDNTSNWTSLIIHDNGFTLNLVGVCGNSICEVGEGPKRCPYDCKARQKFRPGVKAGFWQRDSDVFPCPDPKACLGASQCSNQTYGVMCARCTSGYTFDYFARCTKCNGPFGTFALFIFFLTLLVMLVVMPIYFFVQPVLKPSAKDMRRLSSYEAKQVTPVSVSEGQLEGYMRRGSGSIDSVEKARLEQTTVEELQDAVRVGIGFMERALLLSITTHLMHTTTDKILLKTKRMRRVTFLSSGVTGGSSLSSRLLYPSFRSWLDYALRSGDTSGHRVRRR